MAIALDSLDKANRFDAADSSDAAGRRLSGLPFSFSGKAGEYFGIWIVNILLSVVTLGIYSAWAKVRNKRYFYGNTSLDGSSFAYLASPLQILKGRIIAFAFFAAYAICTTIWPVTLLAFLLLMFAVAPWVMVRARAFNAFQSTYRNVRFGFSGRIGEAFKLYVLWPAASLATLGLALPYVASLTDRFLVENSRYGRTEMRFAGEASAYYRIYGVAFLVGLPAVMLVGYVLVFIALAVTRTIGLDAAEAESAIARLMLDYTLPLFRYKAWLPFVIPAAVILGVVASSYLTTRRQNYLFNSTKVGPHQLALNLSFARILWIRLSNLVLIALSVGLMIPWARIRMARYQIEQMSLIPAGSLDTLVGDEKSRTAAYGDEFGEGMDLDVGLGV